MKKVIGILLVTASFGLSGCIVPLGQSCSGIQRAVNPTYCGAVDRRNQQPNWVVPPQPTVH